LSAGDPDLKFPQLFNKGARHTDSQFGATSQKWNSRANFEFIVNLPRLIKFRAEAQTGQGWHGNLQCPCLGI
jgi:hypothetical protein